MKKSNDSILIIDIYGGYLINMNLTPPHGGYVHMPNILMDFKNAVDKNGKFSLVYEQNHEDKIYIYLLLSPTH